MTSEGPTETMKKAAESCSRQQTCGSDAVVSPTAGTHLVCYAECVVRPLAQALAAIFGVKILS
jgi:hypothetical protein